MRKRVIKVLALVSASLAPVASQACGNLVASVASLTADMHCPSGDGLVVGYHNVRIELNGFTISAPDTLGTAGIRSSGFSNVKIVGPGRITGFDASILLEDGERLEIRGVDVADVSTQGRYGLSHGVNGGVGMLLRNARDSTVEGNRTGQVVVESTATGTANGNQFLRNDMESIYMFGCRTYDNEIAENKLRLRIPLANPVVTYGGTKGNRIVRNHVIGGVFLGGSEHLVEANTIESPPPPYVHMAGVQLSWSWAALCGGMVPSRDNVIRSNGIMGGRQGIGFWEGALNNKAMNNKIYGQSIGLGFLLGADDNDATGNYIDNVPVPVVDAGRGNRWP